VNWKLPWSVALPLGPLDMVSYACMQSIRVEQRDLSYYRGHDV